jgi:hypothetical protein
MSHKTGKIEILGIVGDEMYFKYHQAKCRKNLGKMFRRQVDEEASWLDDLKQPQYVCSNGNGSVSDYRR